MPRNTKTFVLLTAVILTLIATPALADRGGNGNRNGNGGNGGSRVTGTIALHSDETAAVSTAAETAGPAYGDSVTFDWVLDGKVSPNYHLTIGVMCMQGETMVYNWYGQPDFAFPLADQNSTTWYWDGGDAECTASLRYFAHNRIEIVGTTTFAVYGTIG